MTTTREDLIPNSENQEIIIHYDKDFYARLNNAKYNPETFPAIAFDVMSCKPMQTKSHLCRALQCSKRSLYDWIKKYQDFADAIETGLTYGESLFRNKLADHAFKPQASVNNGLIKLLAKNVYNISEDLPTVVINNSNISTDPTDELRKRGIPLPTSNINDVPELNDQEDYLEEE